MTIVKVLHEAQEELLITVATKFNDKFDDKNFKEVE